MAETQEEVTPKQPEKVAKKSSEKKPSHIRHKRPPKRLSRQPNDVYVNRTSQFGSQLARCSKLLDQGYSELTIHGLGSAIHRAINLALQLKETSSYSLEVEATTSTVELVDDLEPVDDDTNYRTQTRPNSAIHIRLFKVDEDGGVSPHNGAVSSSTSGQTETSTTKTKQ